MAHSTVPVATRLLADEKSEVEQLVKQFKRRSPADLYAQWIREGMERAKVDPERYAASRSEEAA